MTLKLGFQEFDNEASSMSCVSYRSIRIHYQHIHVDLHNWLRALLGLPGTSHHRARSTEPNGDSDDADSAHWGASSSRGPDGRREGSTDVIGATHP